MGTLNEDLDNFIKQYDQKLSDSTAARTHKQQQADTFLIECETFFDMSIQPLMQQVGETLKSAGHEYKIKTTQGSKSTPPVIAFEFTSKGSLKNTEPQQLSFTGHSHSMSVAVWWSSRMFGGRQSGPMGDFTLDKLTPQFLQAQLLKVVQGALA